jgi:hypothetical protein
VIERRIKELAIAMEALSRVNGYDATNHFTSVSDLMDKAIKEAKEPYNQPPTSLPNPPDDGILF